jgi:hypothetical protein
VLPILSN